MYFLFTTFWDSKWQPKCLGIIVHWAKDSRIYTPIIENQDSNLMNFVNLIKYVVEVLSMKHQFLLLLKKNPPAGVANKLSFCWYCFPLIGCSYSTSALNFPFSWSSLPPWKMWILGRTLLNYSKSIGLITTFQPITVVKKILLILTCRPLFNEESRNLPALFPHLASSVSTATAACL